jgi:E3 ubiquitin-protein ligase UBR7
MFQCLGLGTVETGGCGEDWWHPECLIGLPRDWHKANGVNGVAKTEPIEGGDATTDERALEEEDETPLPPGFPAEDDFWQLICFKCLDSAPWLKKYAGTPGFLPPVFQNGGLEKKSAAVDETKDPKIEEQSEPPSEQKEQIDNPKKRKAEDDIDIQEEPTAKKAKEEEKEEPKTNPSEPVTIEQESSSKPEARDEDEDTTHQPLASDIKIKQPHLTTIEEEPTSPPKPKHTSLPPSAPTTSFSLFLQQDFHDHICRCAECYPHLAPYPQLREEEDTYEPPLSDDGEANAAASTGTGSLLERGEAALSNVDRVRAIEGAMIYNHLRDKVKDFLKPFAESGQAVSAEDIKGYFEKLRGDEQGIQDAAGQAEAMGGNAGGEGDDAGDSRREQNGKFA